MTPLESQLEKIADRILANSENKNFSEKAFFDATLIFQTIFADKVFDLVLKKKINEKDALKMIEKAGSELRSFIKNYTNINTVNLAKNYR